MRTTSPDPSPAASRTWLRCKPCIWRSITSQALSVPALIPTIASPASVPKAREAPRSAPPFAAPRQHRAPAGATGGASSVAHSPRAPATQDT
eukprot:jgi/Mesen1/9940/ME000704S09028